MPDLSLRIEKRENEIGKKFDDLQRQNRLLMAKILLMENEKILQDSNEIQVQEQQKNSEIITKENVHRGTVRSKFPLFIFWLCLRIRYEVIFSMMIIFKD